MITIDRTLLLPDGMPPTDLLLSLLNEQRRLRMTRLDSLKQYFDGAHPIMDRVRPQTEYQTLTANLKEGES